MRRWIIAVFLCALLALSSGVYAAAPEAELGADNRDRVQELIPDVAKDKNPIVDEESDEQEVSTMSTQGAIWPKGIW